MQLQPVPCGRREDFLLRNPALLWKTSAFVWKSLRTLVEESWTTCEPPARNCGRPAPFRGKAELPVWTSCGDGVENPPRPVEK